MAFIRIIWIQSGKRKLPYKYLVKNVRKNGKVRQHIVKYFGRIDYDEIEQLIKDGMIRHPNNLKKNINEVI